MYKIRKYIISLSVMLAISLVFLLVVSSFVYVFKWQADKAVIGIIVTYILVGIAGGVALGKFDKKNGISKPKGSRSKVTQTAILTAMYLIVLTIASSMLTENTMEFTKQTILIMLLEFGSVYMGRNLIK